MGIATTRKTASEGVKQPFHRRRLTGTPLDEVALGIRESVYVSGINHWTTIKYLLALNIGLKFRKYGQDSTPTLASHGHPALFLLHGITDHIISRRAHQENLELNAPFSPLSSRSLSPYSYHPRQLDSKRVKKRTHCVISEGFLTKIITKLCCSLVPDLSPGSRMSEIGLDSIKIQDPQSVQFLGPAYRFESSWNMSLMPSHSRINNRHASIISDLLLKRISHRNWDNRQGRKCRSHTRQFVNPSTVHSSGSIISIDFVRLKKRHRSSDTSSAGYNTSG